VEKVGTSPWALVPVLVPMLVLVLMLVLVELTRELVPLGQSLERPQQVSMAAWPSGVSMVFCSA
jgi:hypothetical protein